MALKKPRRRTAVTAAALAVLVSLVCLRLGFWQLNRLDHRRELNASIALAATHPPAELDRALVDSVSAAPASFLFRTIRVRGSFQATPVLIRGRSLQGRPGVHLIVPIRLAGGELALVNQGWLPSPDGATVDPRPYLLTGIQTFQATIQSLAETEAEVRRLEVPLPGYPVPSYLRLSRTAVASELGEAPLPVILQLSERPAEAAELPVPVPPSALDEGSHLGYAIQWFSFAVIALGGALALLFRGRR